MQEPSHTVKDSMKLSELERMLSDVRNTLVSHGYRVELINYPKDHDKRSIDVIAVHEDKKPLLVKVVRDVADLTVNELRELQNCGTVLQAQGIIVAESDHGVDIDDIVAHEKMNMYVVSVDGFKAALRKSIYVLRKQNNYYMKVDGKKLREKRLEKGYSLGDIAHMLSVTRRSVYMYEQEESMVSLSTGLKLVEIFGEEVIQPIDIIDEGLQSQGGEYGRPRSTPRTRLARVLAESGYNVAETRYVPPNAIASSENTETRMVVIMEKGRVEDFEVRLGESERVAKHINAYLIAVVNKRRSIANRYDAYLASSLSEVMDIALELKGEKKD
jgi:putative transcriptional regulator